MFMCEMNDETVVQNIMRYECCDQQRSVTNMYRSRYFIFLIYIYFNIFIISVYKADHCRWPSREVNLDRGLEVKMEPLNH